MEQFEKILIDHNCLKRTEPPKTKIEEIEEAVGFKLPNDYKTYLQTFQPFDDFIGEECFYLTDIDELIEMNKISPIFNRLPDTLGIGGNGSSELIAIEKIGLDSFRVVLTPFIDLDKQYHIEIGNSFSDFLIRLENGRQWFEKKDK